MSLKGTASLASASRSPVYLLLYLLLTPQKKKLYLLLLYQPLLFLPNDHADLFLFFIVGVFFRIFSCPFCRKVNIPGLLQLHFAAVILHAHEQFWYLYLR
jgi:hypothetical protein